MGRGTALGRKRFNQQKATTTQHSHHQDQRNQTTERNLHAAALLGRLRQGRDPERRSHWWPRRVDWRRRHHRSLRARSGGIHASRATGASLIGIRWWHERWRRRILGSIRILSSLGTL